MNFKILALAFLSAVFVTTPINAQSNSPKYPAITAANARQINRVGQIGRGSVSHVAWSPDGSLLAVSGSMGIWLYKLAALHQPPQLISDNNQPINLITFSPDGATLAYTIDKEISLWDVKTGHKRAVLTGHLLPVSGLAFSPDSNLLATTDYHWFRAAAFSPTTMIAYQTEPVSSLYVWNVADGTLHQTLPADALGGLQFSPDGKSLLFADNFSGIHRLDLATGATTLRDYKFQEIEPPMYLISTFSRDGRLAAIGGRCFCKLYVNIYATAIGEGILTRISLDQLGWHASSMDFSPDGTQLAVGNDSLTGSIILWDVTTGTQTVILRRTDEAKGDIKDIAFSPDGKLLAATDNFGLEIWDVRTHQSLISLNHFPRTPTFISGQLSYRYLEHGYWNMFNAKSGQLIGKFPFGTSQLSPDGTLAATGNYNLVMLWDVYTGKLRQILESEPSANFWVMFSPDGKWLASANTSTGIVKLWDVTNNSLYRLFDTGNSIANWQFSPDSKLLVTINADHKIQQSASTGWLQQGLLAGKATLWDITTGQHIQTIDDNLYLKAVFSPDSHTLALTSDIWNTAISPFVTLWDVQNSKVRLRLPIGAQIVQFSSDARILVTSGVGGTVVWDATTGSKQHVLATINTFPITSSENIVFSQDGSLFVLIESYSDEVLLCSTQTGQILYTLPENYSYDVSFALSPDGTELVTTGGDGLIRQWAITPLTF